MAKVASPVYKRGIVRYHLRDIVALVDELLEDE
jgi:hypothetical protein